MKLIAALAAAALIGAGCTAGGSAASGRAAVTADTDPSISITPSTRDLLAGETSTVIVSSKNTIGHDAHVEWATTGGDLKTEENGRIARVTFPEAGVYTVTARLVIDGREADRRMTTVNVRPLK